MPSQINEPRLDEGVDVVEEEGEGAADAEASAGVSVVEEDDGVEADDRRDGSWKRSTVDRPRVKVSCSWALAARDEVANIVELIRRIDLPGRGFCESMMRPKKRERSSAAR